MSWSAYVLVYVLTRARSQIIADHSSRTRHQTPEAIEAKAGQGISVLSRSQTHGHIFFAFFFLTLFKLFHPLWLPPYTKKSRHLTLDYLLCVTSGANSQQTVYTSSAFLRPILRHTIRLRMRQSIQRSTHNFAAQAHADRQTSTGRQANRQRQTGKQAGPPTHLVRESLAAEQRRGNPFPSRPHGSLLEGHHHVRADVEVVAEFLPRPAHTQNTTPEKPPK